MPKRVLGLLLILLELNACSPRFVRVNKPKFIESYLNTISAYNSRLYQIKATLDIKGLGFLGHHFHERADFIAQKPHNLLWSMRSFFETPVSIVASNGEFITAYDFSGQSAERYKKLRLENNNIIELFDFRFHVPSLLNILLADVPLSRATNINFGVHENLLEYSFDLPENWQVRGLFDLNTKLLTQSTYTNSKYDLAYHVNYLEPVLRNGVLFPSLYNIRAKSASHVLRFELRITQGEINTALIEQAFFYLKPL